MTTKENITRLNGEIKKLKAQIKWLKNHESALDKIGLPVALYADRLDFDNLTHKETVSVIRHLGGKWSKTPQDGARINYETEIDGMGVRVWKGEPPPNCKMVPVEVHIPARIETQYRLECKKAA